MGLADIGVYGLGTMGSALALNLAGNGFDVAITNREVDWIDGLLDRAGSLRPRLIPESDLSTFIQTLKAPRLILFMIPSGAPIDEMLTKITPLLSPGDTLIDGGNADFNDTVRRSEEVQALGVQYVGLGVSGGAEGARHGPSMMMGGPEDSWQRLRPLLEAIAAKFDGDPCVARLGPDGAGHFVKTVHNGIEYADMQMMAEIYGLLRDGAGRSAGEIGALFETWSQGPLSGFLVETTALALSTTDPETHRPTVDVIRDAAGQKGTGRWTVIEALKLGQSASAIEAAVGARSWSSVIDMRAVAQERLPAEAQAFSGVDDDALQDALLAGRILSHAQGFDILSAASEANGWALDLSRIAEIWRAGCIIRSVLLDDFAEALKAGPTPGGLVLAPGIIAVLEGRVAGLRRVVSAAVTAGLPVPSLSAALAWYDTMRQARGTANLIQAQRDIFGAHGFERLDQPGKHHGSWRLTRD